MDSPIIIPLDYDNENAVLQLVEQLDPHDCRLKVGKELFTRCGPALVETLQKRGFEIFLDLKYHDIPNTVAGAVRAAADLGVWMVNVHASGGRRMMEAAREAIAGHRQRPQLIAVTVLTSMSEEEMGELGWQDSPAERVLQLAALTAASGLDGVVCSAQEASRLRAARGEGFTLVTPGIRLAGDSIDDQRRVVTPTEAVRLGSDYLVIGRSITASAEPLATLRNICTQLAAMD